MERIKVERGSGNVFTDLGFSPTEAQEALAKSALIALVGRIIAARGLTQAAAAKLCATDQPTLSKVLRGRMEHVTLDRLTGWLIALGRSVEIRVKPARTARGSLRVVA